VDSLLGQPVHLGSADVALEIGLPDASGSHLTHPDCGVGTLLRELLIGRGEGSGGGSRGDANPAVGGIGTADHGLDLDAGANHRVDPVDAGPLVEKVRLPTGPCEIGIEEGVGPVDLIGKIAGRLGVGEILPVDEFDSESIGKTRRLSDDNRTRRSAVRHIAGTLATTPGPRCTKIGPWSLESPLGRPLTSLRAGGIFALAAIHANRSNIQVD